MSLGSTTVEDSSMLRSVYRNSRHASVSDVERGLLDSYFSLHMSVNGTSYVFNIPFSCWLSTDADTHLDPPFYTSEIVANSINPTFRTFDTLGLSDTCDNRKNEAVIKLWSRNSVPESASIARDSDTLRHQHDQLSARRELSQPKDADNFRLMLEWEITLDSLTYLCCNVREESYVWYTKSAKFFVLIILDPIVDQPTESFSAKFNCHWTYWWLLHLTRHSSKCMNEYFKSVDYDYWLHCAQNEVLGSENDDRTAMEKLLAIKVCAIFFLSCMIYEVMELNGWHIHCIAKAIVHLQPYFEVRFA